MRQNSCGGSGNQFINGAHALCHAEDGIGVHLIADGQGVEFVNAACEGGSDGVACMVGVAAQGEEQHACGARFGEVCGPRWEGIGTAGELGFFGPTGCHVRSFDYGHDVASEELNVVAQGLSGGANTREARLFIPDLVQTSDGINDAITASKRGQGPWEILAGDLEPLDGGAQ